ncbi:MAG: phosphonate ABC transporter ATP-binding protein [Burkholderiales bacterium]
MKLLLQDAAARHPAGSLQSPAAVSGLNLALDAGEQVAIIGPSGAGKTSLLHLLACALKPASGSLQLAGQNPWQLPTAALQRLRSQLFLAPQVPPLPPRQRVVTAVLAGRLPHISLWQSLRSLAYPSDIALAQRCLAQFDMQDKLFERVDRLSGGERQRVALARALASQATLWLVDEPLSALDPTRSQQALLTLTQSARERGVALAVTLHHVEMALAHFPRIWGLRRGELVFDLPAAQVSSTQLLQLYEQDTPTGSTLEANSEDAGIFAPVAAPAVMSCR